MSSPSSEPRVPLDRLSVIALRIGIVGLVGYGLLLVWSELSFILLPFAVAILLSALLSPVTTFLDQRLRLPRALAAVVTALLTIAFVAGLLTWVAPDIVRQGEDLVAQIERGIDQIPDLLHDIGVKDAEIQSLTSSMTEKLQDSFGAIGGSLSTGVISAAQGVVSVVAAMLLVLIMLIYLLFDGRGFWYGLLRFVPAEDRDRWHEGGVRAWEALTSFVRSQVLVAAIDGIGIGFGLWLLGIPMAVPIGVLTFILAFIPYIGAILAGSAAVLVGLSSNGVEGALGALVVTLIVQQIESNVLYPVLIGHSVKLHPLTVLLGVGGGSALLGITGAFLATPVIAAAAAAAGWLEDDEPDAAPDDRPPDDLDEPVDVGDGHSCAEGSPDGADDSPDRAGDSPGDRCPDAASGAEARPGGPPLGQRPDPR